MLVTDRCIIDYHYSCSFTDFTAEAFDFCRFDDLNNVVFLAKNKTVYGYSLGSGDLVTRIDFDDEVVDFHILYNK
jgi:hypothetical protein